ncbi:MAG: type II toxin-antitoxin system YafQ family toxin [Campylobacterales bacterium]|nr:type II toxin-antitoxin system YafQ family toxin [Campylobacterales bacterium]
MLSLERHKIFVKDLQKVKMSDKYFAKFILYLSQLLENKPLPPEALDHALHGNYKGCREFHISGDLLVMYKIEENTLKLIRIGTHAQLFE